MKVATQEIIVKHITIKNLKECLKYIGITQAELAKSFNFSKSYISYITKGRRYCPEKVLKFIDDKIKHLNEIKE